MLIFYSKHLEKSTFMFIFANEKKRNGKKLTD